MADNEEKSIEDILAAARAADGGGKAGDGGGEAGSKPADEAEGAKPKSSSPEGPKKSTPPAGGSVADILAAARAADSGESTPAEAAPKESAPKPAAQPKKPAAGGGGVADILAAARASDGGAAPAKPAGGGGGGGGVEDILAAARAADSGAAPPKGAPKAPAGGAKPKATPKPKADPTPAAAVEAETSSILAAARGTGRRGPVSKSEAARGGEAQPKRPAKEAVTVPPMPEKPGYARPPAAASGGETTRRGFLDYALGSAMAIGFSSLTLVNLLWLLGLARFMFPNILTEPPTRFKVGVPDDYAPGQVQEKFKAEFGVWVVRYEFDGQPMIYALSTVCTHLGCTPNWLEGEQKFKCPCHGSGFYKDGVNFEGPAPRPLERYAITLADDGQLEVDKSKQFQEEKGQWRDPSSYVPV